MSAMLTAIYARYSTDRQRETSVDDQFNVCEKRALSEGWSVIATYCDNGVSGSIPVGNRPGGADLLADSRYTVLIVEGLDRLSRDIAEQETIVRRLEFRDIRIIGVADGYDSEMSGKMIHRGMRGIINQIYLDDLRYKTHRGMSGQVERGLHIGGTSYGYTSVEVQGGYDLTINEDQAKWVRWAFKQYRDGMGYRAIAHELNRLRVPSPRSSTWAISTIYGSPKKGSGILNNDLYRGLYIWNRSKWVKNPDTGKRTRVERPESEWKRFERPDLQIIPDDLWNAVKRRQRDKSITRTPGKPPGTLLAGILRCGICGAPYVAVNSTKYGCSHKHDRGTCDSHLIRRDATDTALIDAARNTLMSEEAIQAMQKAAREYLNEQKTDDTTQKRLQALEREIAKLTDAIAQMGLSDALRTRLVTTEAEKRELQDQIQELPEDLPMMIPRMVERYKALLDNLPEVFKGSPQTTRQALADLFGEVRIVQDGETIFAECQNLYGQVLGVSKCGSGGWI